MRVRGGCARWWCAGVAALMALAALLCAIFWNMIFDSVLASQLVLRPGTKAYAGWEAPDVPLTFDIYLFNWTNAENFPGEVPNLQEVGPYRFSERRKHVNVTWHENGTVSYRTQHTWHHDAAGSAASLDDTITSLNMIAASAAHSVRFDGILKKQALSMFLGNLGQQLWVRKPARQLLFEGYQDTLLDMGRMMGAAGDAPVGDKFGWFYGRNDTFDSDGEMLVTGGTRGVPGQLQRWNGLDHLPYYTGQCAELSGSAGEFLQRPVTGERLALFVPDLCRTLQLRRAGATQVAGLDANIYSLDPDTGYEDCFCGGACGWRGVMNVSSCRHGAPALLSLPHLLSAEPRLRAALTGLTPDPDKHSFYIAAEPSFGVPLDVAARFQLNVHLEPHEDIALFSDVPSMVFPVLWVEQRAGVSATAARQLRGARGVRAGGAPACLAAAAALAALAALALATLCCRARTDPADTHDDAELKLNPANNTGTRK